MTPPNLGHRGQIYRIFYTSSIELPFGDPRDIGIPELIKGSRPRNAALGITGLLFYDDVYFRQILEGPRDSVEAVFASIAKDRRHSEVTVTDSGIQLARAFPDSPMHFVSDTRARRAIGGDAVDVCTCTKDTGVFAALMCRVIVVSPATWSAAL